MIVFGIPRICTSNFKDGSTIVLVLCMRNDSSYPLFRYNSIVFVEFGLDLKATISSGSSVTGMKILAFVCFPSLFSPPSEVKAMELGYTLIDDCYDFVEISDIEQIQYKFFNDLFLPFDCCNCLIANTYQTR